MNKILTFLIFISTSQYVVSQNPVVNDIQDASNFLGAYFSPFSESIGAGLNRGWYNTAKPHKLAGFDVSLSINLITVSDELSSFDANSLDNFSSSSSSTPTLLGSGEGATISYQGNEFVMPNQNINLKTIPIPTLNAGVGLIKGTEVNLRYIPSYNYDIGFVGKGSIELYGFGLKHDILQWLPLNKLLPFDLSFQGAFSQFNTSFEVESQSIRQDVSLDIRATTFNLILSKKFSVVSAYASVGQNTVNSTFTGNTNFKLGSSSTLDFDLPLNIELPKSSEMQASAGVRFQFAIFTLYANQTFSSYPVTSAGIGLSFR
ncbi:MAG: hypothetical protein P8I29_02685 [Flavobacteriales bacterium]|jgi:hypothetical protein|nr:hypothetical protein [Flavobacteriales bacterium]MDG1916704.1 hypothetical protein [Flavobacteriales bacterium]|tara:strand:+ start:27080 stop:28030 length:951 start_codon:yes stop_codon:yes gene_type:complete